jgi:hypothetical protein
MTRKLPAVTRPRRRSPALKPPSTLLLEME